jgi:hypothetical protein
MIAWNYVNTTAATIAAVRDYTAMRHILINTPDEIVRREASMEGIGGRPPTGMPKAPQAATDTMADSIYGLDAVRARYRHAVEFIAWFEPGWEFLAPDERQVLSEYYRRGSQRSGAVERVMETFHVSSATAERMRSRALRKLRVQLFGRP